MTRVFLVRLGAAALIAMMAATLISMRAATAATLKPSAVVTTDLVTLGDLFDGAGALADTPVFRAPDAGVDGALPASAAIAAAETAGLAPEATTLDSVKVVRAGTEIGTDALLDLVRAAVAARLKAAPETLDVTLDGLVEAVTADASADTPVTVSALSLQATTGRFAARLSVDIGADQRSLDLSGRAVETVDVVVLKRAIERRQVIKPDDVAVERLDRRRIARTGSLGLEAVVGMAATRALRAGEPLIASDLEAPRLVGRGELVTLTYERPGISLSARGRALGDGAVGQTVSVLNEQSRRTVEGVVVAAGLVRVEATAPPAATAALTQ